MSLPSEMLVLIVSHATPSERGCLRRTCWRLRKMIDGDAVRWLRATGVAQPVGEEPMHVHVCGEFLSLLAAAWHGCLARTFGLAKADGPATFEALLCGARAHPGLFTDAMATIPTDTYYNHQLALLFAARLHATGKTVDDWKRLATVSAAARPRCVADLDTCIDYVRLSSAYGARNLRVMRLVVGAIRAGATPLVCPPHIHDGTDAQWSEVVHHAYIEYLNKGKTPISLTEYVAQRNELILRSSNDLLRLRAARPVTYIRHLRRFNLWRMAYDNLQQTLHEREQIIREAQRAPDVFRPEADNPHYVSLLVVVEELLRNGPSERLRGSMDAARASGAYRALEQLVADVRRSATLLQLVGRVRVRPAFFRYHTVDLALADAQILLRFVAPKDEFDALIHASRRKRAHSPERGSRRVRARTKEPLP